MRSAFLVSAAIAAAIAVTPAFAQSRANRGLVIDVKPRSWLDAGTSVQEGHGRGYVTQTHLFNGMPVNGISSQFESNLPNRPQGAGFKFDFLGGHLVR